MDLIKTELTACDVPARLGLEAMKKTNGASPGASADMDGGKGTCACKSEGCKLEPSTSMPPNCYAVTSWRSVVVVWIVRMQFHFPEQYDSTVPGSHWQRFESMEVYSLLRLVMKPEPD